MDDIILWFIPVFVASLGAELFWAWKKQRDIYERKDTLACLAMGLGNVIIAAPLKFFWLWLFTLVYRHHLFELPMTAWWSWALLLVGDDFCYYWFHRCHHRIRLLWCTHVNHHSSQRFNFAAALRQPWTEAITGYWFWLPLPLLGFHPAAVLIQMSISLIYQFFVHTEAVRSLGPLEWLLNTPSHHRVHHGSNPRYLDRNYGGIFIVWDRLFGSFEPEGEPVRYGLTKNIHTFNPLKIAFHEWIAMFRDLARARNAGEVWRAVASPPGSTSGSPPN